MLEVMPWHAGPDPGSQSTEYKSDLSDGFAIVFMFQFALCVSVNMCNENQNGYQHILHL